MTEEAKILQDSLSTIKTQQGNKPYLGKNKALNLFRFDHPAPRGRIITTPLQFEPPIFKAEIWIDDVLVATGHASPENMTTTFRKVESAAIRRALENAGYNEGMVMLRLGELIGVDEAKKLLGSGKSDGDRRMGQPPKDEPPQPPRGTPPPRNNPSSTFKSSAPPPSAPVSQPPARPRYGEPPPPSTTPPPEEPINLNDYFSPLPPSAPKPSSENAKPYDRRSSNPYMGGKDTNKRGQITSFQIAPADLDTNDIFTDGNSGPMKVIVAHPPVSGERFFIVSENGEERELKLTLSLGLLTIIGGPKVDAANRNPDLVPQRGAHRLWTPIAEVKAS